jgi:hypothetical protein
MHSQFRRTIESLVICALLLLFAGLPVVAQVIQGSVAGVVKDPTGAAIPGATVTLINAGTNDLKTTQTSGEGSFVFNLVSNGTYKLTFEKEGFASQTYSDVLVTPGQQYSLVATLKVGAKSETVEVVAGQDIVNTSSSEVSGSVTQNMMQNLPLNSRNPISLIHTMAGTPGVTLRETTSINGGRSTWTQLTQDGISIQDNFIRSNALDFVQNRPTSDTVSEFSIISTNPGADMVGGSSQVRLRTPNGTNAFHGSVYEFNRNSALAANTFFNKHANPQVPKPFLNLNQFGFEMRGPVIKNKLFFYGMYEGYRQARQVSENITVPVNPDYLTGTYRYVTTTGTVQAVNVLDLINKNIPAGTKPLTIDPTIQKNLLSAVKSGNGNAFNCGDSTSTRSLNTNCYRFNQPRKTNRDQEQFRLDYNMTQKHALEFVFQRFTDYDDRTDIDYFNNPPKASLATNVKLFVGAWRWTINPNFLNEFRAGDNSSVVPFINNVQAPEPWFATSGGTVTQLSVTNPNIQFLNQGRNVTSRQYIDNATFTHGSHNFKFGGSYMAADPHTYNFAGLAENLTFGFTSGTSMGAYSLTNSKLPVASASSTTASNMNAYAAILSGVISSYSKSFYTKSPKDGSFTPGYPNTHLYHSAIWDYYGQDDWRVRPNLTVTAGLKWEYWTPIQDLNSVALLPVIKSGDFVGSLLDPNGSYHVVKNFWNGDKMQFAPTVGFNWDPFRDGKTSIRGGYAMTFVNEDNVTAAENAIIGNNGLTATVNPVSQALRLSDGVPAVPTPAFNPNRSYTQAMTDFGVTTAAYGIDPNLRTPYVNQFNFGIQRELGWDTAVEARYVGSLGRDLWRGVDYNQQTAMKNSGYVNDFMAARSNLFLCGAINAPSTCAAGQKLTWFPTFDQGGLLTNGTVINDVQQGLIGELANLYVTNPGLFPSAQKTFLVNPNIYVADGLVNGGNMNYNSLQMEVRHRMRHGMQFQANYTYSKSLADQEASGSGVTGSLGYQNRFEPFMDNARPHLNYGRSPYDISHAINTNYVIELPFGKGRKFLSNANGLLDRIVGGWKVASVTSWQTGSPFGIMSLRGTYNRTSRSNVNTAYSTLSRSQMKDLLGVHDVNGNLYWLDPKVIGPNGQAVGADVLSYNPTFTGQAFFNPLPGQVGNMQKLLLSGPSVLSMDLQLAKSVKFTERFGAEYRLDAFNALNHTTFYIGDQNINSSTFGRITSTGIGARVIQMSLRVKF